MKSCETPANQALQRAAFGIKCLAAGGRAKSAHRRWRARVLRGYLAVVEYGLPQFIRTDNGVPFATNTLARLSRLSAWWVVPRVSSNCYPCPRMKVLPMSPDRTGD